jgi:hypothetical protein
MKSPPAIRDERTIAVENASYRWGYLLLAFGILVAVAYRSLLRDESNFDLLALVILSGLVTTVYQGAYQVLSRRWLLIVLTPVLLAGLVAALLVIL